MKRVIVKPFERRSYMVGNCASLRVQTNNNHPSRDIKSQVSSNGLNLKSSFKIIWELSVLEKFFGINEIDF